MERPRLHRRLAIAAGLAVSATALVAVWIELRLGGGRVTLWVDDGVTPVAAALACIACLRAGARHEGRMRVFWLAMGLAAALWTLAEITWGVYPLILDRAVPSPSAADVGYLSAVVVAVIALIMHPAMRGGGTRTVRSVLDGIAVAGALLFVSWTFVLGPLWRSTDLSTAGGIVTVAYPFADIVVIFFVVLAIRRMNDATRVSMWWLLFALLALAFSDSVYTYLTEVASYSTTSANLIDVGWIAAYLGIGIAALASEADTARVPEIELSSPSLVSLVAPLLLVLFALSVAAVRIELGHHLDRASWAMAFGLIAAVLVRQGLLIVELLGPGRGGVGAITRTSVSGGAVGERAVSRGRPGL